MKRKNKTNIPVKNIQRRKNPPKIPNAEPGKNNPRNPKEDF